MTEPLRVRFVPGVMPDKWLRTWERRMPDSPLDASVVDEADQTAVLRDGEADMCFVRLPVDREGLHAIPLYTEVPVVVASKDHPVAAFEEVDVADLAGEHLLQDPDDVPEWRDVADEVREGTRVEVPPMTTAQRVEVAASGAGVVVLPLSLARVHHRNDVVHRPLSGVAGFPVGLAWRVDENDPRIETFIGIVRGRTERSSRGDEGGSEAVERSPKAAGRGSGSGGGRKGATRGSGPRGAGGRGTGGRGSGGRRGGKPRTGR